MVFLPILTSSYYNIRHDRVFKTSSRFWFRLPKTSFSPHCKRIRSYYSKFSYLQPFLLIGEWICTWSERIMYCTMKRTHKNRCKANIQGTNHFSWRASRRNFKGGRRGSSSLRSLVHQGEKAHEPPQGDGVWTGTEHTWHGYLPLAWGSQWVSEPFVLSLQQ
jgi:hypothetical protein